MTLTRLSLLALALASITISACFKDDTGEPETTEGDTDTDTDADTDTDTDTDTDPVNYFEPYLYSWGFEGGVVAGELATVSMSHGDIAPTFYFEMFEKDYLEAGDDRYSCMIAYDASASTMGTSSPAAFLDIVMDLSVPSYSTCDNLDPNVWGDDEYAIFAGTTWELGFEEMGQDLIDVFIKQIGEDKFDEGWAPYTYGVQTYQDGAAIHSMQTMYGYAWPVEDGVMDESGELLEITAIAMGADGFYTARAFYMWYT